MIPVSLLQKTRRKLEDALQRLECLYEKLREQAVSRCHHSLRSSQVPDPTFALGCGPWCLSVTNVYSLEKARGVPDLIMHLESSQPYLVFLNLGLDIV